MELYLLEDQNTASRLWAICGLVELTVGERINWLLDFQLVEVTIKNVTSIEKLYYYSCIVIVDISRLFVYCSFDFFCRVWRTLRLHGQSHATVLINNIFLALDTG